MKTVGGAEILHEAKHQVMKTVSGAEILHEAKHHVMKTGAGLKFYMNRSIT